MVADLRLLLPRGAAEGSSDQPQRYQGPDRRDDRGMGCVAEMLPTEGVRHRLRSNTTGKRDFSGAEWPVSQMETELRLPFSSGALERLRDMFKQKETFVGRMCCAPEVCQTEGQRHRLKSDKTRNADFFKGVKTVLNDGSSIYGYKCQQ